VDSSSQDEQDDMEQIADESYEHVNLFTDSEGDDDDEDDDAMDFDNGTTDDYTLPEISLVPDARIEKMIRESQMHRHTIQRSRPTASMGREHEQHYPPVPTQQQEIEPNDPQDKEAREARTAQDVRDQAAEDAMEGICLTDDETERRRARMWKKNPLSLLLVERFMKQNHFFLPNPYKFFGQLCLGNPHYSSIRNVVKKTPRNVKAAPVPIDLREFPQLQFSICIMQDGFFARTAYMGAVGSGVCFLFVFSSSFLSLLILNNLGIDRGTVELILKPSQRRLEKSKEKMDDISIQHKFHWHAGKLNGRADIWLIFPNARKSISEESMRMQWFKHIYLKAMKKLDPAYQRELPNVSTAFPTAEALYKSHHVPVGYQFVCPNELLKMMDEAHSDLALSSFEEERRVATDLVYSVYVQLPGQRQILRNEAAVKRYGETIATHWIKEEVCDSMKVDLRVMIACHDPTKPKEHFTCSFNPPKLLEILAVQSHHHNARRHWMRMELGDKEVNPKFVKQAVEERFGFISVSVGCCLHCSNTQMYSCILVRHGSQVQRLQSDACIRSKPTCTVQTSLRFHLSGRNSQGTTTRANAT
jgi:hypothetical protein